MRCGDGTEHGSLTLVVLLIGWILLARGSFAFAADQELCVAVYISLQIVTSTRAHISQVYQNPSSRTKSRFFSSSDGSERLLPAIGFVGRMVAGYVGDHATTVVVTVVVCWRPRRWQLE